MSWLYLNFFRSSQERGATREAGSAPAATAFGTSRSGNVAIIFALSLVPLIGLVGIGIDYGMALSTKAKLDNAADAAAIAAVATAKAYIAANSGSQTDPALTNNALAAGQDRASRAFAVNAGSLPFVTSVTPNIPLPSRSGQTFTATVSYTATEKNNFGKFLGRTTTPVSGNTAASADIPSYLDFYLLIDVSASMGLPSTLAGQNTLANANGGCQFACHFPDQINGYNYAVNNNIQLRSGAVNTAVCGLLNLANQPTVPGQYRVGLYPFVTQLATLSAITASISNAQIAATCNQNTPTKFTSLLDNGSTQLAVNGDLSTGTGSGGTHVDAGLSSVQTMITSFGDGSSARASRPFVFLITDGMENTQYFQLTQNGKYTYPGGSSINFQSNRSWWTGGTNPSSITPTWCNALKNANVTVSILYIPYNVLTVGTQNQAETQAADNAVLGFPSPITGAGNTPDVHDALQRCASDGYFVQANTPQDINNALAAMFAQAVQVAHLLR